MRKMAKQLKTSEPSMRRIVQKRLGIRSYVFATGHDLSDPKKRQVRVDCCKKLLKEKNFGRILFSDEKVFTVLPPLNRRNSRILGRSKAGRCRIVSSFLWLHFQVKRINARVMKPMSIMVWAGITSKGKTELVFVPPGTEINAKYYQEEVVKKFAVPLKPKIFQQDGAPAHSAKSTISFLKANFSRFLGKRV